MDNKTPNPEILVIENTLKMLRRGKFELEGEEALVFYRLFEFWVKRLNDLKKPSIIVEKSQEPIVKSKKKK